MRDYVYSWERVDMRLDKALVLLLVHWGRLEL